MSGIPAVYMRGGTSKGVFFHSRDVPEPGPELDDLLLRIMGSPDALQIDGMGGTYSSTSKVVIVEPRSATSVTYRFAQVGVDRRIVDWSGNCGNLTTAVGPFAVDEGLVTVPDGTVAFDLHNANTGVVVESRFEVTGGSARINGDAVVPGVPGSGAPIMTSYLDPAGSVTGALLPTGAAAETIDTGRERVRASIVDVTHPYVFVAERGENGVRLTREALDGSANSRDLIERIRAASAVRIGAARTIAEATATSPAIPRIVVLHQDDEADLAATAFSMGQTHRALPMTAALCLAATVHTPGTVAADIAAPKRHVTIRHPKGVATVIVDSLDGAVRSVGVVRTARRIMDGTVYPRPKFIDG